MKPIHIQSEKDEIAEVVLMPGDPLRAKYIADTFLTEAKLVNTTRNMLAFTGFYKEKKVTVMGSGMGMPSIGIYSYELFNFYDVKKIIRIGTAGSLNKNIKLMDIILSQNAYSPSNFAYIWGGKEINLINANKELNNEILNKAKELNINVNYGTVLTTDVFTLYADISNVLNNIPQNLDILANEMETFGLLYVANLCGKEATSLITIVDSKYDNNIVSEKDKVNNLNEMIKLALETI